MKIINLNKLILIFAGVFMIEKLDFVGFCELTGMNDWNNIKSHE
jgi:hypothetical protein